MAKASPGGRATIHDVARAAGVSSRAVTRVTRGLNEVRPELKSRIEAAIARLGYAPNPDAQTLTLGRSQRIGLLLDNPNPDYVMRVQAGILEGLRGSGYELVVHACEAGSAGLLDDLQGFAQRLKLHGLVLIPPFSDDPRIPPLLDAVGCVYVRIASTPAADPARTVRGEDRAGARMATRRLLALGHRRIALIAGPDSFASSRERRAGFEDALSERGVTLADAYVFSGGYTFESGIAAGEALLSLGAPPTAVFASNDEMAAGFLQAAHRRGLTAPDDFSLIGFDDLGIASVTSPPLSTVRMPTREFGRRAARLLTPGGDAGEGDLYPSLIVRGSCGSPPGGGPPGR
jgi:LacI family transcriptional regulator